MRKISIYSAILFFSFNCISLLSQDNILQGITDGKEYWLGLPYCKRGASESVKWGKYPIELWVSSKVETTIWLESCDSIYFETHTLEAKKLKVMPLTDFLENKEGETVTCKCIHIIGDDAISIGFFLCL